MTGYRLLFARYKALLTIGEQILTDIMSHSVNSPQSSVRHDPTSAAALSAVSERASTATGQAQVTAMDDLDTLIQARASLLTVMGDESADNSNTEQLALYLASVVGGVPQTHFVGLRELSNGEASTITTETCQYLGGQLRIDLRRLVWLGSDGAATFTGDKTGVLVRLRDRVSPFIAGHHCLNHVTALIGQDASNAVSFVDSKVKPTLEATFIYFNGSPLRSRQLQATEALMGEEQLKIVRACSTRWLSSERVVGVIRRSYASLLSQFIIDSKRSGHNGLSLCLLFRIFLSPFSSASQFYGCLFWNHVCLSLSDCRRVCLCRSSDSQWPSKNIQRLSFRWLPPPHVRHSSCAR
jgi:hypothetical protein